MISVRHAPNSAKPLDGRLVLSALGIVYGDIGTSPLYAMRESLLGCPLTVPNILGVLSLIFWSLVLIISIKYLLIVLRADNNGEGGVLAVLALFKDRNKTWMPVLLVIASIGAGLLWGDGMLTPSISVLSAVEGLQTLSPKLSHYIIPITLIILALLFLLQHRGTGKIGAFFGPIILIWFIVIGTLGLLSILKDPVVLQAINPKYAYLFLFDNTVMSMRVLGGVFLVLTGGEALYADLGHFGRLPVQVGWFCCALPGLLLNYFGQGALLLHSSSNLVSPFFQLSPTWFLPFLLLIATLATIIASQATISAGFSLARQAMLLNLIPEMEIRQTSATQQGQIYVPVMNRILFLGTISLVLIFQTSSALAGIYGIAVNMVMLIVTFFTALVARTIWKWSLSVTVIVFSIFLTIDIIFLIANLHKFGDGGFVPLLIALSAVLIMLTWYRGSELLRELFYGKRPSMIETLCHLQLSTRIHRIPNLTAIFITDKADESAEGVLHYLKLNHSLPERVILLSILIEDIPFVTDVNRFELKKMANGFYRLMLHYGFMQHIDIMESLEQINKRQELPLEPFNFQEVTFFTESKNIVLNSEKYGYFQTWEKQLFSFLQRNSLSSIDFYGLPASRTITIGVYCEI